MISKWLFDWIRREHFDRLWTVECAVFQFRCRFRSCATTTFYSCITQSKMSKKKMSIQCWSSVCSASSMISKSTVFEKWIKILKSKFQYAIRNTGHKNKRPKEIQYNQTFAHVFWVFHWKNYKAICDLHFWIEIA